MSKTSNKTTKADIPASVSGVELMRGIGHRPSQGFWAEAWSQVVRRGGAIFGLVWIGIVAFFACFSPFIANGHPYLLRELDADGTVKSVSSPLWEQLSGVDLLLAVGAIVGVIWLYGPFGVKRSMRLAIMMLCTVQAGFTLLSTRFVAAFVARSDVSDAMRILEQRDDFAVIVCALAGLVFALLFLVPNTIGSFFKRAVVVSAVGALAGFAAVHGWSVPPSVFDYQQREAAGTISAIYAPIPFSTNQRDTQFDLLDPGISVAQARVGIKTKADYQARRGDAANLVKSPRFVLGTDSLGQDVLAQLLHACRLSISIGLISTSIAVFIGVTLGSIMGYFGGWIDMALFRIVEIFMAIPVLFLLIVAAGVLPPELRSTYVIMAIIGCFTWTGAARFIRAEFFKLRGQDFVQSARAAGLPLRSVLFKHMLPNGVTPVLVDASFAIAVAILFETVLSYLGLGPPDQASWGRLLAEATNQVGDFVWNLAVFPGFAIFLTVLAFTLINEAMRDAIDPKLKKARI